MDRIFIFDTTLRDGEQSPGAAMTLAEKLRLADMLDAAGVDVIEAGFPAASEGDFAAVVAVAERLTSASAAALARAAENDIRKAGEALRKARKPRIHTFIATSALHMEHKLRLSPEQVLEKIDFSVRLAREYADDVEWSCEDGTRSERAFLCTAIETAIAAGATVINVPDTVGYAVPEEYFALITHLRQHVAGAERVVFSTHCHDDLGLATANSLAAVRAGARQIECTINGMGERAGNAALEEVVMALRVRRDAMPFYSNIDATKLTRLSAEVSQITGFPVAFNKAVVGRNAFAHESGIHQDGMLKHAGTYEIMRPADVGLLKSSLPLGKLSGRNALAEKMRDLGEPVEGDALDALFVRFKALADRKKHVYDEDLRALLRDAPTNERLRAVRLRVVSGTDAPPQAEVVLSADGVEHAGAASGDGPIDAIFNAVRAALPHAAVLESYDVRSLSADSDALAHVSIRLRAGERTAVGRSSDPDTQIASLRAYLSALGRLS